MMTVVCFNESGPGTLSLLGPQTIGTEEWEWGCYRKGVFLKPIPFHVQWMDGTAPPLSKRAHTVLSSPYMQNLIYILSAGCEGMWPLSPQTRIVQTPGIGLALPSSTPVTMEAKLSSSKIMSAAFLAASDPAMPIAIPISAFFRAGESLTPSPVTATTACWGTEERETIKISGHHPFLAWVLFRCVPRSLF